MAATADHSMVLQHLSRSRCNAGPTEARIGPGPRAGTTRLSSAVKVESEVGWWHSGEGSEVRARPQCPQAEDDLELPVCAAQWSSSNSKA